MIERKDLETENERLREALSQKLIDETLLRELVISGDRINVELEGGVCRLMAELFASLLVEFGAENYIESSFVSKGLLPGEHIVVTVQKTSGKTPHQKRLESELKYASLVKKMEETRDFYHRLIKKCNEMNLRSGEYVGIEGTLQQITDEHKEGQDGRS